MFAYWIIMGICTVLTIWVVYSVLFERFDDQEKEEEFKEEYEDGQIDIP